MNQQNQIRIGNLVPLRTLTATEVGYPDSEEHLTKILRTFNYTNILITLARINLLLQCSDVFECENILRRDFCSNIMLNEIQSRNLTEHMIFSRESTLLLLSKSAHIADPNSRRASDSTVDAKNELARCYLIANKYIGEKIPDVGTDETAEQREEILAGLIPSFEYVITPSRSPRVKSTMVRSKEFLAYFQKMASRFDVNETFSQATGLTAEDYQHLIFSILVVFSNLSPEEILKGVGPFVDTKPSPALTSLYEKLLPHTCISIDELARKAATPPSLPNEFLLLRKYPLVEIGKNQIMCIDLGFLLDKLATGVFWIIRDQLEKDKTGGGQEIIRLQGEVFEDYASSIIERGISAQTPASMEKCIIQPKYLPEQEVECTDIAVCGCETLILLECKASLLHAQAKFSGDALKFYKNLKDKFIEPKGIKQLCNAMQFLGHTDEKKRRKVEDIDIFGVKKIYPVLVISDRIFSLPSLNQFLDSEFQRLVADNDLEDHLKIMPLTVLTIEDLEFLEPYLRDTPFHAHLDKWITHIFKRNDFSRSTSIYVL